MGKKPAAQAIAKAKETKEVKLEAKEEKKVKAKKHAEPAVDRAHQHCKVKSCKREYRAKGYCTAHYKKWRQGEFGVARYKTCKETDCRKPMTLNRHGYCEDHYQKFYVKGEKTAVVAPAAPVKTEKKEEKQAASA